MLNKKIEKLTVSILEELQITKLPIPIDDICHRRGLKIKAYDLGENVSGVLVIDGGIGTIGYNPCDPQVRQRFTIAHELGHYELHRKNNELFIDKSFKVLYRDGNSSSGEIKKELEANAFAAAILMPEIFLVREIERHHFDFADELSLRQLAKLFNVSAAAMSFRIANLNLFSRM